MNRIPIHEATAVADIRRFRAELGAYHARDIFPREEDRDELTYFLGEEYRGQTLARLTEGGTT